MDAGTASKCPHYFLCGQSDSVPSFRQWTCRKKARENPGPFLKKRTLWRAHAFTTDAAGAKYYGSRRIAISN